VLSLIRPRSINTNESVDFPLTVDCCRPRSLSNSNTKKSSIHIENAYAYFYNCHAFCNIFLILINYLYKLSRIEISVNCMDGKEPIKTDFLYHKLLFCIWITSVLHSLYISFIVINYLYLQQATNVHTI